MSRKSKTLKQQRLIANLKHVLNSEEKTTLKDVILASGYSESTALQQQGVMRTIKDDLQNIIENMTKKRDMALKSITKEKLDKSSAKALSDIVDKLNKNILHLQKYNPDKSGVDLSQLSTDQLRKLAMEQTEPDGTRKRLEMQFKNDTE